MIVKINGTNFSLNVFDAVAKTSVANGTII